MKTIEEVKELCRFVAQGIVDESEKVYHRILQSAVVDGGGGR